MFKKLLTVRIRQVLLGAFTLNRCCFVSYQVLVNEDIDAYSHTYIHTSLLFPSEMCITSSVFHLKIPQFQIKHLVSSLSARSVRHSLVT